MAFAGVTGKGLSHGSAFAPALFSPTISPTIDVNQKRESCLPYREGFEIAKESPMKSTVKILAAAAAAALILVSGSLVAMDSALVSPGTVSSVTGR